MKFKIAADITPLDQIDVPIHHPADTAKPTGIVIALHGKYTEGWRKAQKAYRAAASKGTPADDTALADELRPFLAHATADWTGVTAAEDDAPVPCTPEMAEALYIEVPWLYEQVFAAFLETGRFFGSKRTDSSPMRDISSTSTAS